MDPTGRHHCIWFTMLVRAHSHWCTAANLAMNHNSHPDRMSAEVGPVAIKDATVHTDWCNCGSVSVCQKKRRLPRNSQGVPRGKKILAKFGNRKEDHLIECQGFWWDYLLFSFSIFLHPFLLLEAPSIHSTNPLFLQLDIEAASDNSATLKSVIHNLI